MQDRDSLPVDFSLFWVFPRMESEFRRQLVVHSSGIVHLPFDLIEGKSTSLTRLPGCGFVSMTVFVESVPLFPPTEIWGFEASSAELFMMIGTAGFWMSRSAAQKGFLDSLARIDRRTFSISADECVVICLLVKRNLAGDTWRD
jgi:hypothetical protein